MANVKIPVPDAKGALSLWDILHLRSPPPQRYIARQQNPEMVANLKMMETFRQCLYQVEPGFDVTKLAVSCTAPDDSTFTVDYDSFVQQLKNYKFNAQTSFGAVLGFDWSTYNDAPPPTDADWSGDQASSSPHWDIWGAAGWRPGYTTETELYRYLEQSVFRPSLAAAAAIARNLHDTDPDSFRPVHSCLFTDVQTGGGSDPDFEARLAMRREDAVKNRWVTVSTCEVKPARVAQPLLELLKTSKPFFPNPSSIEDANLRKQMAVCLEIVAQVWGQMNDKRVRFGSLVTESQFVLFHRPNPHSLQYSVIYDRRAPELIDVSGHDTLVHLAYMHFLSLTKAYEADEPDWPRLAAEYVGVHVASVSHVILANPMAHPSQDDTSIYRCQMPDLSRRKTSIHRSRRPPMDCILKATNADAGYERFVHEARCYETLRSMQGKGVPRCLGLLTGDYKSLLLLTEYSGEPIQDFLQLSIGQRLSLLSILINIHKLGIEHCDLEPRNILLDRHNRVVVIDFGFAQLSHVCHGFKYCPELQCLRQRLDLTRGHNKGGRLVSVVMDLSSAGGACSMTVLMDFIFAELTACLRWMGLYPIFQNMVFHSVQATEASSAVWLVILVCILAVVAFCLLLFVALPVVRR